MVCGKGGSIGLSAKMLCGPNEPVLTSLTSKGRDSVTDASDEQLYPVPWWRPQGLGMTDLVTQKALGGGTCYRWIKVDVKAKAGCDRERLCEPLNFALSFKM